jgi:hypothetical protein
LTAHGGNPKQGEKTMASKKKASKKLKQAKKIQPTKPLAREYLGAAPQLPYIK